MPPRRRRPGPISLLCRAVAVCALGVSTLVYTNKPGVYDVSDRPPLAQTFAAAYMTSHPGDIYSVDFSVLVSTSERGPALISRQPAAVFRVVRKGR